VSDRRVELETAPWGGRNRRYDLIKEGVVAVLVITIVVAALSTLFGSPDDKQITFKKWAVAAPADFYSTAVHELAGTSGTAGYGAPYNTASDGVNLGPLHLAKIMGVTHPVDTVNDFVITPLSTVANATPVADALKQWQTSDAKTQSAWATNYDNALAKVNQDSTKVTAGNYGPVPQLAGGLLTMAQAGSLDGALLSQGNYFQSDYTKQTLFLGDGSYFNDQSTASNLQGSTWGMMNETGRYPGQAWLWLYSFWYQISPFNNPNSHPLGANADAWIMVIMGALSLGLIVMPLIPGIRSLPYKIKIHRLIWKNYYQEENL
jgi:hypothetical protein